MDDLVSEFLTETNESLQELDLDLVNLEQNPNDKDLLSKIFRLMHTIKGTCGFLGLPRLEKIAHHAENVLGRFREGDLEVTPEYVTLIFESIDCIKFIVENIAQTGAEPEGDDSTTIAKLDAVYESGPNGVSQEAAGADGQVDFGSFDAETEAAEHGDLSDLEDTPEPLATTRVQSSKPAEKTETKAATSAPPSNQSLRVNVDVLENLMTMVSELVLTRNQLLQISRTQTNSEYSTPLQRLNHVVSELQEGVMKTRMQPIGNAWAKLPRIIRDLSLELGKKIDLQMIGQDTELDRQVLELIKDPLTHMVRNSGDHGIETPEERRAAGKNETGKIVLNAYHEGGHIIITISDDGKGLGLEKIKSKILQNGLASEEELAQMAPQQIYQFIFKAGFSTAQKVTSVSGRGVGMDVVRTNIEKIGGSIELDSNEGKGSIFTIKIPLTLAIVSALVVEAAGERFAIPQLSVRELVMTSESGDNRIETIKGAPVLRLRNRLLPLVSLSELLKFKTGAPLEEDIPDENQSSKQSSKKKEITPRNRYIVVTQVGSYSFGIIVNRVFDTEEIVVKPVAKILRHLDLFSGNTILGDGSVIMILDPNGIAKATGEMGTTQAASEADIQEQNFARKQDKTTLLLFKAGSGAPKAVPLSLVARLENVKGEDIEHANDKHVIQYRGRLMTLIPFSPTVDMQAKGEMPVLVFMDQDNLLGLVVEEIIDITEEHIDLQMGDERSGLMGSAIIENKATDIIDVGYYLSQVNKNWFKNHGDEPYNKNNREGSERQQRVLLVDDSPFFRNMLTPLLSVAGYHVTTLESPVKALEMCNKGEKFDVIISDIEMPEMDGFEFAEKIKTDSHWKDTPMVALSSHATPEDITKGHAVGFEKYIAKFDRDTLLSTLSETLSTSQNKAA